MEDSLVKHDPLQGQANRLASLVVRLGLSLTMLSGVFHAGTATATVRPVRVDTYKALDDYLYPADLPGNTVRPMVTSLAITRREGTNLFEIDYVVQDADSATVAVRGVVLQEPDSTDSTDSTNLSAQVITALSTFVEGTETAIGNGIATGTDAKHLVWDASADLGHSVGGIRVQLLVSDGRPPLSLHFVTLPAAGDLPELSISKYAGFGNPAMLDSVWLWCLAGGSVVRDGTQLVGAGAFEGQVLSEDCATPTTSGREFLLSLIGGVRLATEDEIRRAQEATTPGIVTQWEPVRQTAGRPLKVNEYGIETGAADALFLVRDEQP